MSDEWEEKFHAGKQRKYWKNKTTGKTTWTEPFVKAPSGAVVKVSDVPTPTTTATTSSSTEEEWEEKYSEKHQKKYWKNKTTGKTSWKEPPAAISSEQPAGLSASVKKTASLKLDRSESNTATETNEQGVASEWEEKFHAGKQSKYWKNKTTGKSSWTEPPQSTASISTDASSSISSGQQSVSSSISPWGEDWKELFSAAKNRKYWKNLKTGKSQWSEPPRVSGSISSTAPTSAPLPSGAHWEPLKNAEEYHNLKAKHSELSEQYNIMKGKYSELESVLTQSRRTIDELKSDAALAASSVEASSAEMESKLQEKDEQMEKLTSLCELYKKSHAEAEERFQEAKSKEKLSAADIASLQEQHENSVRQLNAELELNVIREKTKGESSLFDVTRQLNEKILQNEALKVRCDLLIEERDEMLQKVVAVTDAKVNIENSTLDKESIYKEISARNEQLLDEVTELENKVKDIESQRSNTNILLDEYKQNNSNMSANFAEEKVKLTIELENKTEILKSLEDKCEELEAQNHKLIIERDLLKEINGEADNRQANRREANGDSDTTVEDIKLDFSNKIRRLNAEHEIKLLEEKAIGEKNVLDVKREHNDLKTLHEYLNSRYSNLADEKKMFVTEINQAKQQIRDLRVEKEKLIETLHLTRDSIKANANTVSSSTLPTPPPPPPLKDKNLEKMKHYELEIDNLQRKYQELSEHCEQITAQRDAHKQALNILEAEKTNWEGILAERDNLFKKLTAENEMYKSKYEESEVRFHVWENESESKGKIWTQSMKELQMLHESQSRKMNVEFEIQLLEERSKAEKKLFATVSKLNSLKVTLSQMEAEANIKYDALRAEKDSIVHAFALLREKEQEEKDNKTEIAHPIPSEIPTHKPSPRRLAEPRLTNVEAAHLFSIIKKFDRDSSPPDSPPPDEGLDVVYDYDDTPPNSPPPSDDEGD